MTGFAAVRCHRCRFWAGRDAALHGVLAGAGLRTVLVERKHVGGTCVNEGCTPTKTMAGLRTLLPTWRAGARIMACGLKAQSGC